MGVSYRQFYLLSAMATLGPSTQRELADYVGHSDPAISRMLTTLLAAGYVTSATGPADRRVKTVQLTGSGAELAARADEFLGRQLSELLNRHDIDEAAITTSVTALRDALVGAHWAPRRSARRL